MSAYIGFVLEDGAFLAADSRLTNFETGITEVYRKILPLIPGIVIAIGGLATQGELARDELMKSINRKTDLEEIVSIAAKNFKKHYENSLKDYPNHGQNLFCIIAGSKPLNSTGFVCVLQSVNDFVPLWMEDRGMSCYFGSNSLKLREIALAGIFSLKENFEMLPLDLWAIETFNILKNYDKLVDLPGQLVISRKILIDRFPVSRENLLQDFNFSVNFPKIEYK